MPWIGASLKAPVPHPLWRSGAALVFISLTLMCVALTALGIATAGAAEQSAATPTAAPKASIRDKSAKPSTRPTPEAAAQSEAPFPLGVRVSLVCETEGIGVASAPPTQSKGQVELTIRTEDAQTRGGRWWLRGRPDSSHTDSFATLIADRAFCPYGCPMVRDRNGNPQLWSPRIAGLADIEKDDILIIAVLTDRGRDLKASTFEGQAPLIFEKGVCTSDSTSPADADPVAPPNSQR